MYTPNFDIKRVYFFAKKKVQQRNPWSKGKELPERIEGTPISMGRVGGEKQISHKKKVGLKGLE